MISMLAGAFLAGLAGSPHCVGMCGGLAAASAARGPQWPTVLGRLSTYATLGALAGALSHRLPLPAGLATLLAAGMLVWFAARLADLPLPGIPVPALLTRGAARLLGRRDLLGRFAFGVVNGLLPCGLVYAALSLPIALGEPLGGALTMLAFGLGTVPALAFAARGARLLFAGTLRRRRILSAAVLGIGLLTLASRAPHPPFQVADHAPLPVQR